MGIIKQFINSKDVNNEIARSSGLLQELDAQTREKLQAVLLDMYRDVKAACDRHGIALYLIGGSALGAIRHRGFIPWDDDLDLGMTREDYQQFKKIFDEELSDKYILNAPNRSAQPCQKFPRILKRDSYYRSVINTGDEELNCIFLDLFIVENTPDNAFLRKLKGLYCNCLGMLSWEVFIWEHRNPEVKAFLMSAGAMNYYIRIVLGFLFSFRSSRKWFDLFDRAIRCGRETKHCCIATGRKRYLGEVFLKDQFFPGILKDFEGEKVLVFRDQDSYLKNLYGDYMTLPPVEKRERHNLCELYFSREEMRQKRALCDR